MEKTMLWSLLVIYAVFLGMNAETIEKLRGNGSYEIEAYYNFFNECVEKYKQDPRHFWVIGKMLPYFYHENGRPYDSFNYMGEELTLEIFEDLLSKMFY